MLFSCGRDGEDDDGDMDLDTSKEVDEALLASAAAQALGKESNDIADAFKELDMDHYDDDDEDGTSREIFLLLYCHDFSFC